jgi:hypothetical protein
MVARHAGASRPLAGAGAAVAMALVGVAACSGSAADTKGGLELIIVADGLSAPADFDDLRLEVSQRGDGGAWTTLHDRHYVVPSMEATLPATFAILAGRAPDQEVLIKVTAYKGGPTGNAVVLREAQVQAPTDFYGQLWLVLAQRCLGQVTVTGADGEPTSTCPIPGQSCLPSTGSCGSETIVTGSLPPYVPGMTFDSGPPPGVLGSLDGGDVPDGTNPPQVEAGGSGSDASSTQGATDSAPGSDSASGSVDAAAFAAAADTAAVTQCSRLNSCFSWIVKLAYGTQDVCTSRTRQLLLAQLSAPGSGMTPATLASCVTTLNASSCLNIIDNSPGLCPVPAGHLGLGSSCIAAAQCQSAVCSFQSGAVCGSCAAPPPLDGSCSTNSDCQPSQLCNAIMQCATPVGAGVSCDVTVPCQQALACKGGLCALPDPVGSTCDPTAPLATCDTFGGNYCDPVTSKCLAIQLVDAGGTCSLTGAPYTVCSGSGTCSLAGKCVAPANDGQSCNSLPCLPPAICQNNVCTFPDPGACQ